MANRETRNLYERRTADSTIGRKEDRKEALRNLYRNPAHPGSLVRGSNRSPCHCGFGLDSPNSVSTTAEDGLRVSHEKWDVACLFASINNAWPARQRCGCHGAQPPRPAASRSLPTAAPALASKSNGSLFESTPRSAPAGVERSEEDNVR